MMEIFLTEITSGWPDSTQLARVVIRLTAAVLLGAIIGLQRERVGKPAGLRTHMLVSGGSALLIVASLESDLTTEGLSRVIQGVTTGIGFLGAGAILKILDQREITGLTTAASVWMTAAVGIAAGLGHWGSATVSVVLTWIILAVLGRMEMMLKGKSENAEA